VGLALLLLLSGLMPADLLLIQTAPSLLLLVFL